MLALVLKAYKPGQHVHTHLLKFNRSETHFIIKQFLDIVILGAATTKMKTGVKLSLYTVCFGREVMR